MSHCKSPTCAMELGKREQDIEWLRAQLKAEKEAHERHSSLNGELVAKLEEAQVQAAHIQGEFNLRDRQARRCADDYGALQARLEGALGIIEFYSKPENFELGLEPDKDGDLYPMGAKARVFLDQKILSPALREWTLNVNRANEIRGAGDVLSAHVGAYYADNEYVRVREVRKE